MKILKKNLKNGELTVKVESVEDLWVLEHIIEPEDLIKGKTERKIKLGGIDDRNMKVIRKQVFLTIKTEKISVSDDSETLRILGLITDGPENVPRGEHHSFNIEKETVITIYKNKWFKYQLSKIEEATKTVQTKILLVIFDREEAYFVKLKGHNYELISKISGDVQKKEDGHVSKGNFYKEIIKKIEENNNSNNLNNIIIASPGFWREDLLKLMPSDLKKKTVSATVSHASESAISEVLKRDELKNVLEQNRGAQNLKLIDSLLQSISKDQACYGLDETKEKVELGAVKELFVSLTKLKESRNNDEFEKLERIMIKCEEMNGKIHLIDSEEALKKLDSISGIAGILRWKT